MTCAPGRPTFRLLDPRVGWHAADVHGLIGADAEGELRLAPTAGAAGEDPAVVGALLGDRRLATGCGPCEWFLLSPGPPPTVLRLNVAVHGAAGPQLAATPVWSRRDAPVLPGPVAVAARGQVLAVADRRLRQVLAWDGSGSHAVARITLGAAPSALAVAPWGELLVATAGGPVLRFGLHGEAQPATPWRVPGTVVWLGFPRAGAEPPGDDEPLCPVVLVVRGAGGARSVWLADAGSADLVPVGLDRAATLLGPSRVAAVGDRGFCLTGGDPTRCWSWTGAPVPAGDIGAPPPRALEPAGQLLTRAIDSGVPGCVWHRIEVDADVPPGTGIDVAVATSEQGDVQPARGVQADPRWAGFPGGKPHAGDWQEFPADARDALIDRPPGRYLFLRLRLTGDGAHTPAVHGIRLDLPRRTSLEYLPGVWHDEEVDGFTSRFLSLFDRRLEDLDRAVERYPALLDAAHVPDGVLPWLAGLLGLSFDPAWTPVRRRELLRAAPELYRRRGTPDGLRAAVRLVLDVDPVIEELGALRTWGSVGGRGRAGAALGSVRLFGAARVRFRLDRSQLSRAPLRSLGDPRRDAQGSDAYRFQVLVPRRPGAPVDVGALQRLVDAQAPAHTVGTVRVGGTGLVVGPRSRVGVDTLLVGPPAPVLGGVADVTRVPGAGAPVQLNRDSVLWPGRGRGSARIRAGDGFVVGVDTVVR